MEGPFSLSLPPLEAPGLDRYNLALGVALGTSGRGAPGKECCAGRT